MDDREKALQLHRDWQGKIRVAAAAPVADGEDLALAYTPGVAWPCLEIQKDEEASYDYTGRGNRCLVVTDGSAVLGLGDIGSSAAMPVMEGKCLLFKAFGEVDAFPLCLDTRDSDAFVEAVTLLAGSFGGINLEDIAAPRCFHIEDRLKETLDIPVFHDDQHGTAIVVLAGLINALALTGRKAEETPVVISGAGAASAAVARLLMAQGFSDLVLCDRQGAIVKGRPDLVPYKKDLADWTNPLGRTGSLQELLRGAPVFIGLSGPDLLDREDVAAMAERPILFACANPRPEIDPAEGTAGGAAVMATGRSDYPNQINNVLAFPGVFRGAFDAGASTINEEMKLAAAEALAGLVSEEEREAGRIIPDVFDERVVPAVAEAVARAARESGVAKENRAVRGRE